MHGREMAPAACRGNVLRDLHGLHSRFHPAIAPRGNAVPPSPVSTLQRSVPLCVMGRRRGRLRVAAIGAGAAHADRRVRIVDSCNDALNEPITNHACMRSHLRIHETDSHINVRKCERIQKLVMPIRVSSFSPAEINDASFSDLA